MFVACILTFLCAIAIGKNLQYKTVNVKESKEPFLVEPGEKLPINKLDLIKEENNDKKEKYKEMLFIDPYCESCLDKIVISERMYNIFKDENIEIKIIWRNRPQDSFINKIDILKDNQYITKQIDLLNEYPLYLLVD